MKYYIVIGHKKGEEISDIYGNSTGKTYDCDWIEVIERDEIYGRPVRRNYYDNGYEQPGAHRTFGFLDVNFSENAQYGSRATETQEAWLIGRHRIARTIDFGNFGYKFVRSSNTKRIQFPEKITLSFDKAIKDAGNSGGAPERPRNDSKRVDIELIKPDEQILHCFDKECSIHPKVFQLAQFDNYGDVYLDLQDAKKLKEFTDNIVHFVNFMKNYPNSNLFLICPREREEQVKNRLREIITTEHLTNYIEFCDHNFHRRRGAGQSSGEYDTFNETIHVFFDENTFNADRKYHEKNFYQVPFQLAKITIDSKFPWERYRTSEKFKNFLKYNPNITLEISRTVAPKEGPLNKIETERFATEVAAFIRENQIKANLFLTEDPNNLVIRNVLVENRRSEIQDRLKEHGYDQLLLLSEREPTPAEIRLSIKKYLQKFSSTNVTMDEKEIDMGQNQNQNENQNQQMITSNNTNFEPIKLEVNSKSSIPDVAFEMNQDLLQELIGLKFADAGNAPQIEANIKHIFTTMKGIIERSSSSNGCYCPLSYSVEELVPGAFYVPIKKIREMERPIAHFDASKNTLFFSPPYASIAIKKDLYAYKPFVRKEDKTEIDIELSYDLIKNDKFVRELMTDYQQFPTKIEAIQTLLAKLSAKRGLVGVQLLTRTLYVLKLKNLSAYETLLSHYLPTSKDLSECIDNEKFVATCLSLADLTDTKKLTWWNKIIEIQCRTNPDFDLHHLYKQFTCFWEDIDKIQNFLPIPEAFPFDDFADAGITLGKMIRIMGNSKNRFDQIKNFAGGNISHAYMLYDLFNTSMYCKEMDIYCATMASQLTAEDAFDKTKLKQTHFSLAKLHHLTVDSDVSLHQLKSYLFIYAAVNGNSLKRNNSDIACYRGVFETIEAVMGSRGYSDTDKKVIYSAILLFASYGNNTTVDFIANDIHQFMQQTDVLMICQGILEQYRSGNLSPFFVKQDDKGKMVNSENMLSFHTISKLFSRTEHRHALAIMNKVQNWIVENTALSTVLQKIMRESPHQARNIVSCRELPDDLKSKRGVKDKLIQSIFLILVELKERPIDLKSTPLFPLYHTILSQLTPEQLELLNKLFLDIDFAELTKCQLFDVQRQLENFINIARTKSTQDDFIFLMRDYHLSLMTIRPSQQGLLQKLRRQESIVPFPFEDYSRNYTEYLEGQLRFKFNAKGEIILAFSSEFIKKLDERSDFRKLKASYDGLGRLIETTKTDDLFKIINLLKKFPIGSTEKFINPYYLIEVTDSLLKFVAPTDNIENFLTHLQSNPVSQANEKLRWLHSILDKIVREQSCYEEPVANKKLNIRTVQQLKACMVLLEAIDDSKNLTNNALANQNTEQYLQFLEVAASSTNIHARNVKNNFAEINQRWNTLTTQYPTAFNDLLDIAKFDISLLQEITFKTEDEIKFLANACRNESSLNAKKTESLASHYKQEFSQNIKTLLAKKLNLERFYGEKQLSHPSVDVLVRLLNHYKNNVQKAFHHFEKDPRFDRPHKKTDIYGTPGTGKKEFEYKVDAFNMEKQNAVIEAIISGYHGLERSVRKNQLLKFSHYINELGFRVDAFPHQQVDGKTTAVPVRKLSDDELNVAFAQIKNEIATLRKTKQNDIWHHKKYQRATCKLVAIIREAMCRYSGKQAYSTQIDAIILAILSGDYNYAMQINTGEGKALIAACIAIAEQTLTDKQIVITTSNLSLATRDAESFDKFIRWFGLSHATISSLTEDKSKLNANIIHTTGADFALCHGKQVPIDNSNRIYLNDEYDYTMSHLTPAINSQTKLKERENWWIYEEILDYVQNMDADEAKKDTEQQVQDLIQQLDNRFSTELREILSQKEQRLQALEGEGLSFEDKLLSKQLIEEGFNGPLVTLKSKIEKLRDKTTRGLFDMLIDSAIIANYVFKKSSSYEIIDCIEEGKRFKKVVPVESGKPIVEGDVMYMYGIHQFLIQKSIKEAKARGERVEFLQPPILESTTYFNNYSTQVGSKTIGITGTIPKPKYQMYKALMEEGRSDIVPPHLRSRRIDAVPFEDFQNIQKGNAHVCRDEAQLIARLNASLTEHDGPTLIYCKDKNECEARQQALQRELAGKGYTVQMIVNGITEDFTDGDKLTSLGRAAQKRKVVTLTVGDGRGIDIKPEGKHGLLTICSFAPDTAEKIMQIYGRSGRNGKIGKTNLFILEHELTNYGVNFTNLAEKFEFLDVVRTREFDFAIKKIGFLQYTIQQKIKNEKHKIQMIDFMDNLYNKLILKAVVTKMKGAKSNTIGRHTIVGRWEPFVMLNDTDLNIIYKEFCKQTEENLAILGISHIHVAELEDEYKNHIQGTKKSVGKEKEIQKGPSSNYIQQRITNAARKHEAQLPRHPFGTMIDSIQRETYHQLELNLRRVNKTIAMMEHYVDSHIGLYPLHTLSPEYTAIVETLSQHKQTIKKLKQNTISLHYQHLARQECKKAVDFMLNDSRKENQSQILQCLNNIDQIIQHYEGEIPAVEEVRIAILRYYEQEKLDAATISKLRVLVSTLTHDINKYVKSNLTDACDAQFIALQNDVHRFHQKNLELLATGTDKLNPDSDLIQLSALQHLATEEERKTSSLQPVVTRIALDFNPSIKAYNQQFHLYQATVQHVFQCESYLKLNIETTRKKLTEFEELGEFSAKSKTTFVFYQNHLQAHSKIEPLKKKLKEEGVILARRKAAVSECVEEKISAYEKELRQLEIIVRYQKKCQAHLKQAVDAFDIVKNYRDKIPTLPTVLDQKDMLKQLRQFDADFSSLKQSILKEKTKLKGIEEQFKQALNQEIISYNQHVDELDAILAEQNEILIPFGREEKKPHSYEKIAAFDDMREFYSDNDSRLRTLGSLPQLQQDKTNEQQVLNALKEEKRQCIEKNKLYYDKFKLKIALLSKKIDEFEENNLIDAYNATSTLRRKLERAGEIYFENIPTKESYAVFKNACAGHIKNSRKVLEHHRGWKKILANVLAAVFTAGIGYAMAVGVNFLINRRVTFWATDSALKVDEIAKYVNREMNTSDLPQPTQRR